MKVANYLVSVAPLSLLLVSAASRVEGSPSLSLPLQEAPTLRGGHSSVFDLGSKAEAADREALPRRRSLADAKAGSSASGADGSGGASGSASSATASAAAPETAASKTDTEKGSIASRTATYSAKKESSLTMESPQAMGIKIVKPETAAPSPAPPKTAATAAATTAATTATDATASKTTSASASATPATTGSHADAGAAGAAKTVNPTEDGTTAPSVLSSKNSGSTASTPTTDDVASLVVNDYDDDSLNYTVGNETKTRNKPLAMPKEKAQPEEWPEIVAGVFVFGALFLMCATLVTNYRKRKDYESIPTSLTV